MSWRAAVRRWAAGVAQRPRWLPALGWRPALAPTPPASASRGSPGWPGPSGLLGAARPGAPDRRGGDQPVRDTAQLPGFPDLGAGHVHRVQGQLPGDPVLDLFNCAEDHRLQLRGGHRRGATPPAPRMQASCMRIYPHGPGLCTYIRDTPETPDTTRCIQKLGTSELPLV
jgi:hypothetical protein